MPHDEPEAVDLDPGARKCAVRTLLAPQYARIKMDGIRLVGGPGTATTTHASTTGSKLTYTLAGGSSPDTPP